MSFETRPSLIARLKDGSDDAAWREFVEFYRGFIQKVATTAGARRDGLADMTQDVWLTVVRVLPRFHYDPSRGRFRNWLACIVRSRCNDIQRADRKHRSMHSHLIQGGGPAESASGSESAAEVLQQAIESVRRGSRSETWQCFQRHALEGQRAADVARELGTTENAVYLNCSRLFHRIETECHRRRQAD
ncbi:MAG TPA: sigma-70 family RNA polymerase sigma factor [Caulifigura sp.]|nr:sigma-70 family RNA polymerase sigma factor [Caulifigura sp.]